ncbi:MAG TPA: hypothetical protein VNJ04_09680 [Gemmatimonadaceae bacterium]|nr:hypothetical protein [Gemmatimonadaceae bacterium]
MGNTFDMSGGQAAQRTSSFEPTAPGEQGSTRDTVISQAQNFADKAKATTQDRVRSAAMTGKTQAAEVVSGLAQSLFVAGRHLGEKQGGAAQLVEQTAEQLDRVAQYLQTTELDELVQRTESWARKNPALFVGGAFIIGAIGARFLKSSRPTGGQQIETGSGNSAQVTDSEVRRPAIVEGI